MRSRIGSPQSLTLAGKRFVLLPADQYELLAEKAEAWEPPMPPADEAGNYPALEAMAVALARDILRTRRRLGLTQVELARRAGIRPETLNRIEQGKNKPSVPTVDKIDRALKAAEKVDRKRRNGKN